MKQPSPTPNSKALSYPSRKRLNSLRGGTNLTASALHWYTKAKIKLLSLALHGMQDSNNQLHSCARKQRRSSARLTQEIEKETVCKKNIK